MPHEKNPNPLEDRRKAQEEEYFRKQNAELAAKLKARLGLNEVGISDQKLIDELEKAGFTADTSRALFFVPLIQMAWADGRVQNEERESILKMAEQRGIEKNSQAYALIQKWTDKEPTDEKFVHAKALVEPFVQEVKASGKADPAEWIISASRTVAEATGGVFGLGSKISKEEEDLLRQISQRLK